MKSRNLNTQKLKLKILLLVCDIALRVSVHEPDQEFGLLLIYLLFQDATNLLFSTRTLIITLEKAMHALLVNHFKLSFILFAKIHAVRF
jgi:hypothetical protein